MKKTTLLLLLFLLAGMQNAFSQDATPQPDFYETDKVQDIKITFDTENWGYVLDSLRFNDDGLMAASVAINGQVFEGAGVKYRGSKSFAPGALRNPFYIVLDHKKEGQNLHGYTKIKLSTALRDPSLVREVLGYEIARTYMPAPKANYARLTINDEYYGLMVNVEAVTDPQFRQRYFGEADNPFFKAIQVKQEANPPGCKKNIYGSLEYDAAEACYLNNFEQLSDGGLDQLIKLTRALEQKPADIGTILNVDDALWMLAFNNVLVNLSSYSGQHSVNYFLYQDTKGRFTPIVWDMNLAFGSFKNIGTGSDLRTRNLLSLDPLLHADNPAKPLISKLLANGEYRKLYLSHVRSILHEQFLSGRYEERAKELQGLIRTDFINDPGKEYTVEDFNNSLNKVIGNKSKIPGIVWLMEKRAEYLRSNPALSVVPSEITEVQVETRKRLSAKQMEHFHITAKVDKFPKKVTLMYRLNGEGEFVPMSMTDNGKADDGVASNNIYGAIVVPKSGERSIEYYIVAENASLFSYSPAAYMWGQHSTTLEELNK